ncbi:MAG TPA: LysR substrate-binding domain-containing protein, partial [Burkholderiaceae bacterium]
VLRYPLALCDPAICEGHARQVDRVLQRYEQQPLIAQRVASYEVMMTLVSAGLALGLAGAAHIASGRGPGVVARRLAGKSQMLATYLLHRDVEPSEMLARFIARVDSIDSADGSSAAEDS